MNLKNFIAAFATAIFVSVLWSAPQAATYYVQPNGSDSNDCTAAQSTSTPKQTIASVIANCSLTGGDTVEVRANSPGGSATLTEKFDCNANPSSSECVPGGSSWSSYVTIQARSGDLITIRPTTGGRIFSFDQSNQQYIEIRGFILDGINMSGNVTWIEDNAHHIRIINNEIKNGGKTGGPGGMGGGCGNSTGDNEWIGNVIHDNGTSSAFNYGLYIGCRNNLTELNTIHSNSSYGIHIYSVALTTSGQIVRRNIVRNNGSVGILVNGAGSAVYSNLIYNNGTDATQYRYGIQMANGEVCQCSIYGNTIFGHPDYAIEIRAEFDGVKFKNNIVYNNSGQIQNLGTNTDFGGNFCGSAGTGCAVTGNPLFFDAANGNFSLQSGSTAINAGVALGSPFDVDIIGTSRPQGAGWDIGAYEFITVSAPPRPINLIFFFQ